MGEEGEEVGFGEGFVEEGSEGVVGGGRGEGTTGGEEEGEERERMEQV